MTGQGVSNWVLCEELGRGPNGVVYKAHAADDGTRFAAVKVLHPDPTRPPDFGLKFPVARDRDAALAARLGAKVTPEAFVIDDRGRIRYRGRIDDQFAARRQRNAHPNTSELRDAVAAVLAGRDVANPSVEAVGCPIPEPPQSSK